LISHRIYIVIITSILSVALPIAVYAGQPKPPCQSGPNAIKPCDPRTQLIVANTSLPVTTSNVQAVVVRYINPFRYHYSLSGSSQAIAAPTPPSIIAAPATTAAVLPISTNNPSTSSSAMQIQDKRSTPLTTSSAPPNLDDSFKLIYDEASTDGTALIQALQKINDLIVKASEEQQCYTSRLNHFALTILSAADQQSLLLFAQNNASVGTANLPSPASCRLVDAYNWPTDTLNTIDTNLHDLQAEQSVLMFETGYKTWIADQTHKAENDQLTALLASYITTVEGKQAPSASQFATFSASLAYIDYWRSRLADIVTQDTAQSKPDQQGSPFFFSSTVDCSNNWYGKGSVLTVTLSITDLSASPTPAPAGQQILVNSCYPPGTVSTGIGLSFVHDRVFAFLPGIDPTNSANTVTTVQTTTDASATPLYAILYNIAIQEGTGGYGLHGAIGGAIGSTSGTTNLEILAGPSFSIRRRAFFITPAFQLARRDQLLPGYHIGSLQGSGLTSLPVTTNWKPGFALIFSFGVGQ